MAGRNTARNTAAEQLAPGVLWTKPRQGLVAVPPPAVRAVPVREPEEIISQTQYTRCVVVGVLLDESHRTNRGACTLVLRYERNQWVFYPHGVAGMAVGLPEDEAIKMAHAILAGPTKTNR